MATEQQEILSPAPIVPEWTLGHRLRRAREVVNMNLEEFAKLLDFGVGASTIGAWEIGTYEPRRLHALLHRYEKVTGVSASWLFSGDTRSKCFTLIQEGPGQQAALLDETLTHSIADRAQLSLTR